MSTQVQIDDDDQTSLGIAAYRVSAQSLHLNQGISSVANFFLSVSTATPSMIKPKRCLKAQKLAGLFCGQSNKELMKVFGPEMLDVYHGKFTMFQHHWGKTCFWNCFQALFQQIQDRIHGWLVYFTYIDTIKINHSCRQIYNRPMDPMDYLNSSHLSYLYLKAPSLCVCVFFSS